MENNNLEQIYNQIYSERENLYGPPEPIVREALEIIKNGSSLELGAGEGRNSLLVASEGLQVTAVDISNVAIEKIKKSAKEAELTINTKVEDIREFKFEDNYNLLITTYVLHHLSRVEALQLIKSMQDHTKQNGLNIITTFTNESDFCKEEPDKDKFYPTADEIKDLYTNWEIIKFETKIVAAVQKNSDGTPKQNNRVEILAKKIS